MKQILLIAAGMVLVGICFYLGLEHPFWFAAITALLTLAFSAGMERSRLLHDRDYFFGSSHSVFTEIYIAIAAVTSSLFKAIIAGFLALLTFAAYDSGEAKTVLFIVLGASFSIAFILIMLGRVNSWKDGVLKLGYFRLAVPLGIIHSAFITALTPSHFSEVKVWDIVGLFDRTIGINNDQRPQFEEASEFLSKLNAFIDQVVAKALDNWIPDWLVPVVDAVLSSNVLQGFVILPYTALLIWIGMGRNFPDESAEPDIRSQRRGRRPSRKRRHQRQY